MIMLGGNPGLGIKHSAEAISRNYNIPICNQWSAGLYSKKIRSKDILFFENSNKNFLALIILKLFRLRISYFFHGDHFLPAARHHYSLWSFIKEVVIINTVDEIVSHSYTGLALAKSMVFRKKTKYTKLKFPIQSYVDQRWGEYSIPAFEKKNISIINSVRINKVCSSVLEKLLSKLDNRDITYINHDNYMTGLISTNTLVIPSESETLCLSGIDAAFLGVKNIIISKRVGLKEYRKDLGEMGCFLIIVS